MSKPDAIRSFDIDGVIYIPDHGGVYPGPNDVIITGRSVEEEQETRAMLAAKGIKNDVYFSPLPYAEKTRQLSGWHKAGTLKRLLNEGKNVTTHFEDDLIQAEIIGLHVPEVKVVLLLHSLNEKENRRNDDWQQHL
jgi:hypothetical protein